MVTLTPVRSLLARWWPTALAGLVTISFIWLVSVYLPILWLEARYQLRQLTLSAFGTSSLAQLIVPDFAGAFDPAGYSRHPEFGLSIPKLQLDEPIIANIDPNDAKSYRIALKQGIAHAAGTSLPGEAGISYLFAHSSQPDWRLQYNAVFYLLHKLDPGDEVFVWYQGEKRRYVVSGSQITSPNDVSFLAETTDSRLVLQTCWPPGTTAQRLLVTAELVK